MSDKSIDENFNPFTLVMIVIAFAGSIFLAFLMKDSTVNAGLIYTIILLGVVAGIVLLNTWLKDDESWSPITDYARVSLQTGLRKPAILYLISLGLPLLLSVVFSLFTLKFSIASFSIPLLAGDIHTSFQSFSASQVAGSMAWQEFVSVYVAGTIETFAFNFGFIFLMTFVGLWIFKMFSDGDSILFIPKKWFVMGFSILTTGLIFMTLHSLNSTYDTTSMFLIAFGFICLANISIYIFGLGLIFWIGFHQMNNLIYMFQTYGFSQALSGFFSIFGLVFVGSIALLVYFIIRNGKETGL